MFTIREIFESWSMWFSSATCVRSCVYGIGIRVTPRSAADFRTSWSVNPRPRATRYVWRSVRRRASIVGTSSSFVPTRKESYTIAPSSTTFRACRKTVSASNVARRLRVSTWDRIGRPHTRTWKYECSPMMFE